MPKAPAKKKPEQPVAPTPPPPPAPTPVVQAAKFKLPIIYPKMQVDEFSTTSAKGPLDVAWMKKAMYWETESEFKARRAAETGTKPEAWVFGEGVVQPPEKGGGIQPVHCKDVAGNRVVCWNNAHNRPFDESWCEDLVHTILFGQWAGPHTMPGETVNGETIRISRCGQVLSGQHSMTAAILADEYLQKARADMGREEADKKYPAWAGQDHVFIESIVVRGMSDDPRVMMTVDYVRPRTTADVFYTREVFKSKSPPERKDLCRMLATGTEMLWTRTDAKGYRTHPEIVAFQERHGKLIDCVAHIFEENRASAKLRLSRLKVSPGTCSALMYLMGCAAVSPEDSDEYRNMEPPVEKGLDWSLWEKAEEFWTLLNSGKDFEHVRTALAALTDSTPGSEANQGLGGRGPEKTAILARAWERWKDHPDGAGAPFEKTDLAPDGCLCLSYTDLDAKGNKLPDGAIALLDTADFLGIDCPEVAAKPRGGARAARNGTPEPPPPTPEELERLTQEALARRAAAK